MTNYRNHLISVGEKIKVALAKLDALASDAILFVVDESDRLVGSLTDGDVRRGFLKGNSLDGPVESFIEPNPKFFRKSDYSIERVIEFKKNNYRIIPVLDDENRIINVVNFRFFRSYLPLEAVIMAGGRGERLRPFTDTLPKPLLKVGDKSIIEHNIDRLVSFGIDDMWICLRYLGDKIKKHLGDGSDRNISIQYVWEDSPLGTIGAIKHISNFKHDDILLTNSDLLTDIDYEDFYIDFVSNKADISIVTIPYHVSVPYAVLETNDGHVLSLKEKPTYTYFSNGGIYLIKRKLLDLIPANTFFNATDFLEKVISTGAKVTSYPLTGYWLDIGRMEDFEKAKNDIKHLKL